MTTTRRHRTLAAGLCLAIVLVAAVFPGAAALDFVVFELAWELVPSVEPATHLPALAPVPAQPRALLALLPPRAPPAVATA